MQWKHSCVGGGPLKISKNPSWTNNNFPEKITTVGLRLYLIILWLRDNHTSCYFSIQDAYYKFLEIYTISNHISKFHILKTNVNLPWKVKHLIKVKILNYWHSKFDAINNYSFFLTINLIIIDLLKNFIIDCKKESWNLIWKFNNWVYL